MEYIPGQTLETLLPSLKFAEKTKVCKLIQDGFTQLHGIPSQGYFAALAR